MKIKRFLRTGELSGQQQTTEELLESAGDILDSTCAHEIMGEVVFEGEDGKFYVASVECVIGEINPNYLKELQEEEQFSWLLKEKKQE